MKAWRGVRQPIQGHSIGKCLSHCLNPALSDPQTHNLPNVYSGERAGQATHLWCIFEAQHYQNTERKRESFIWVKKKSLHMEKDEKENQAVLFVRKCISSGRGQNLRV